MILFITIPIIATFIARFSIEEVATSIIDRIKPVSIMVILFIFSVIFFGIIPLAIEVRQNYSIKPLNMAITMLIGKNISLLVSPMVPATFLAIDLTNTKLKDHLKYKFNSFMDIIFNYAYFAIVIGMVKL